MVLTAFSQPRPGKVKVKIIAGTVCKPHGHVEAGQEVEVSHAEYLVLKENGKAELAKGAPIAVPQPASLEELEAEVRSRGYSPEAAKSIAQKRFDGLEGEEARYLDPQQPVSEQLGGDAVVLDEEDPGAVEVETLTEEQIRAELGDKKKAELVALAKEQYGLELSEDSKKDELVEAILAAIVKGAKE